MKEDPASYLDNTHIPIDTDVTGSVFLLIISKPNQIHHIFLPYIIFR